MASDDDAEGRSKRSAGAARKPHESDIEAVRGWLTKSGYPLELQVGQLFRAFDWRVQHGHIFRDPETSKSREPMSFFRCWC